MDTDELRVAAVALAAIWVLAGLLAFCGARRGGALCNALVAAAIAAAAAPSFGAALIDREAYVRRYGLAALHEIPLDAAVLGLGAVAFGLSLASALRRGRVTFALGWLANAPAVLFAVWLAFWFHIF